MRLWGWVVLLCVCLAVSVAGQEGATSPTKGEAGKRAAAEEAEDDVVRVRTDEVLLAVSVRDAQGHLVGGLERERFMVYDNGRRQELEGFRRRRVPASVLLLLDASSSVFRQMELIRRAAGGFVEGLEAEDRVSIMQFADQVRLLSGWTAASEKAALLKSLNWNYRPGERTSFYAGLSAAARAQMERTEGRRIIVLLTDGIDTTKGGAAGWEQALADVRRAETSVYVISLTASMRAALERERGGRLRRLLAGSYERLFISRYLEMINRSESLLEQLATESGGRLFLPLEETDLAPAYSAIAEELREQYVLTYKPEPKPSAGEWRRVEVLVAPGGYEVSARKSYFGR